MQYNDYNDSIHIVWRKGTPDDPYVDKYESLKVVNHKIVLTEVPDEFHRVKIDGMSEVNIDRIVQHELLEDEYIVDYSSGIILFNGVKEANVMDIVYKGRGFIQYPSSRIYHQDEFNDVVVSLEEIINKSLESVKYLNDSIDGKISDYNTIRDILLEKINLSKSATDNANRATEKAEVATDLALDAYDTTRLVFMPYVEKYSHIAQTYPNPEIGWTTQAYDNGVRYRWDGIKWVAIDLFGGGIPFADETRNGLMSSDTYKQLQKLQEVVETGKADERVLVFCFPFIQLGLNRIIASFPFDGEIQSIRGICSVNGDDVATEIDIEKSSDMSYWQSILSANSHLTFNKESLVDNGRHGILIKGVKSNDVFRVNVRNLSYAIEGVTIEVKIKIIK